MVNLGEAFYFERDYEQENYGIISRLGW